MGRRQQRARTDDDRSRRPPGPRRPAVAAGGRCDLARPLRGAAAGHRLPRPRGATDDHPVPPPALELANVVKRYGAGTTEVRALTDVSLTVEPGEFVAVMGPSGSGKSTLLHLAGGLERPSAGRVLVGGRRPRRPGRWPGMAALRRQQVGFVFQSLNLVPTLTAVENVMLPLELDGIGRKAAREGGPRRPGPGRRRRSARPLPRRPVRRRAAAGGHRPGHRRRPVPAPDRRADRGPRLGDRGRGHRAAGRARDASGAARWSWSPTSPASPRGPTASCGCATAA